MEASDEKTKLGPAFDKKGGYPQPEEPANPIPPSKRPGGEAHRPQREPLPKVPRPAPWPEPKTHEPPTDAELAEWGRLREECPKDTIVIEDPCGVARPLVNYLVAALRGWPQTIAEVRRLRKTVESLKLAGAYMLERLDNPEDTKRVQEILRGEG